jgi:integrase
MRADRKTKVQPSQYCRRKVKPVKRPGESYTTQSYGRAIANACDAAGITRWHPNQLRHGVATAIRRQYGLEAAQVALGHTQAKITEVYAERDLSLAVRVAREIG